MILYRQLRSSCISKEVLGGHGGSQQSEKGNVFEADAVGNLYPAVIILHYPFGIHLLIINSGYLKECDISEML